LEFEGCAKLWKKKKVQKHQKRAPSFVRRKPLFFVFFSPPLDLSLPFPCPSLGVHASDDNNTYALPFRHCQGWSLVNGRKKESRGPHRLPTSMLLWSFYHATDCNNYGNSIKEKEEGKRVPSSRFFIFCHGGFWVAILVAKKEEGKKEEEERKTKKRREKKGGGVGCEKSQTLATIVGISSSLPNLQGLGMNKNLHALKEA